MIALLTMAGCSGLSDDENDIAVDVTENPDAKEVLTDNPDADIFQFDGVIYLTGIDWVEETTLTKDEQVGEIKKQNDKNRDFENKMANKLPVGAKIFSTKEDIGGPSLIVESEDETLKHYGNVEG